MPIPNDLPEDEMKMVFDSINGLFLPGGAEVNDHLTTVALTLRP